MSFRYYIYVSDTKVNMLLSQISPSFHGKRTFEWSLISRYSAPRRDMKRRSAIIVLLDWKPWSGIWKIMATSARWMNPGSSSAAYFP
jgi:hypothetical protein